MSGSPKITSLAKEDSALKIKCCICKDRRGSKSLLHVGNAILKGLFVLIFGREPNKPNHVICKRAETMLYRYRKLDDDIKQCNRKILSSIKECGRVREELIRNHQIRNTVQAVGKKPCHICLSASKKTVDCSPTIHGILDKSPADDKISVCASCKNKLNKLTQYEEQIVDLKARNRQLVVELDQVYGELRGLERRDQVDDEECSIKQGFQATSMESIDSEIYFSDTEDTEQPHDEGVAANGETNSLGVSSRREATMLDPDTNVASEAKDKLSNNEVMANEQSPVLSRGNALKRHPSQESEAAFDDIASEASEELGDVQNDSQSVHTLVSQYDSSFQPQTPSRAESSVPQASTPTDVNGPSLLDYLGQSNTDVPLALAEDPPAPPASLNLDNVNPGTHKETLGRGNSEESGYGSPGVNSQDQNSVLAKSARPITDDRPISPMIGAVGGAPESSYSRADSGMEDGGSLIEGISGIYSIQEPALDENSNRGTKVNRTGLETESLDNNIGLNISEYSNDGIEQTLLTVTTNYDARKNRTCQKCKQHPINSNVRLSSPSCTVNCSSLCTLCLEKCRKYHINCQHGVHDVASAVVPVANPDCHAIILGGEGSSEVLNLTFEEDTACMYKAFVSSEGLQIPESNVHQILTWNERDPLAKLYDVTRSMTGRKITKLFLFVSAHSVMRGDSPAICLSEKRNIFLDVHEMTRTLEDLQAYNLIMYFDFCRSANFVVKTKQCDSIFQLNSAYKDELSYNRRGKVGFFTECLVNGIYGAKKCCLKEVGGASNCQFCCDYREECSRNGVVRLTSLTQYITDHLNAWTLKLRGPQPPSHTCHVQGELYPLTLFPPMLEIKIDGRVTSSWRCDLEYLGKEDTTINSLIGKRSPYLQEAIPEYYKSHESCPIGFESVHGDEALHWLQGCRGQKITLQYRSIKTEDELGLEPRTWVVDIPVAPVFSVIDNITFPVEMKNNYQKLPPGLNVAYGGYYVHLWILSSGATLTLPHVIEELNQDGQSDAPISKFRKALLMALKQCERVPPDSLHKVHICAFKDFAIIKTEF